MVSVYVENYGCSLNLSESEMIKGILSEAGHSIKTETDGASVLVINMCSVKTPTERKIIKRIARLRECYPNRQIIVSGCLPLDWKEKLSGLNVSAVTTHNMDRIAEAVEMVSGGLNVFHDEKREITKLCLPKIRSNPVIGIVPISSGCNLCCSYCVTRLIKGRLVSYPVDSIVRQARSDLGGGCREIWLTAQDTAAYGTENCQESKLPGVIKSISDIHGDFFIRVGMMNPLHAIPVIEQLIEAFRSGKVFQFLHLPLQSGSNRILEEMKRNYTVEDFMEIVRRFRKAFPDITLSTDVICGFPTETDGEFMDTVRVIEKLRPDVLNVSRFWPRSGTPASHMPQTHSWLTKERSRYLVSVFRKISEERNRRWQGWQGKAIIDEYGKGNSMLGRNYAYKQVVVNEALNIGDSVDVRISSAEGHYLAGKMITKQ